MNVFTFVFLVVTVVLVARLIQVYMEQRHSRNDSSDDVARTLEKIDILEDRIQVLERIVTENRFDLKKQIDGL